MPHACRARVESVKPRVNATGHVLGWAGWVQLDGAGLGAGAGLGCWCNDGHHIGVELCPDKGNRCRDKDRDKAPSQRVYFVPAVSRYATMHLGIGSESKLQIPRV